MFFKTVKHPVPASGFIRLIVHMIFRHTGENRDRDPGVGPRTLLFDPGVGPWIGTMAWETSVGPWSETLGRDSHVCFLNILNCMYTVFTLSELQEVQNRLEFRSSRS